MAKRKMELSDGQEPVGMEEPYVVVPSHVEQPAGAPASLARTGRLIYWQMSQASRDFAAAGLGKDGVNAAQKFNFRGIDGLMDLAAPILVKHSLLVLPRVLSRTVETRETRSGGQLYAVALDVEFSFVSALDGSSHTVRFVGEAMDSADKATNKAMSAAYKYAFFQSFCIPIRGAQDEADTHEPEETVAPKPVAPEGYADIKAGAFAASLNGTEALRAYARQLGNAGKDSTEFKAWGFLVKHDVNYPDLRANAEAADKGLVAAIAADVKATGVRVPGEEG